MMINNKTEAFNNLVDLYVRVSTVEQAEEGYSVEEQESKLRAYCQAMGYTVYNVHVDPGFSGSSLDRPGVRRLINDVKTGKIKKVIVWKLDRLSRSQKDTMVLLEDIFLENGCNFVSLIESFDTATPFGRAIVGILAAFAQLERENIRERTTLGRQARIRKGYYHGSHSPLGYVFKQGSNNLVVDRYTSQIIEEIYRLFLSGSSINGIATLMHNKYGTNLHDWNNTSVRRILKNPIYIGKVTLGSETYEGVHDSIISETDFYMVKAILEHNKALDKRNYSYNTGQFTADNLLTGLLYCGDCGARMYARKVSNVKKKYICHSVSRTSKAMIKSDNCSNRLHPLTVNQLDEIIINEIKNLATNHSYFKSIVNESQPNYDNLIYYKERIEEVEKQIERMLNLYQTGLITMDDVVDRIAPLKDEINKLNKIIDEEKHNDSVLPTENAWDLITDFNKIICDGSQEEIHRVVHNLIDKIVVLNDEITVHWSFCKN